MDLCILNSESTVAINGVKSKHKWGKVKRKDLETMNGIDLNAEIRYEFSKLVIKEFALDQNEIDMINHARALFLVDFE